MRRHAAAGEIFQRARQLYSGGQVARGIGLDDRIGSKFLYAGPGFGGSCLPKDILTLVKTAQDQQTPLRVVETVAAVNDARQRAMARKVAAVVGNLRSKTIAVFSLTFKPTTVDMREVPLVPFGARVRAYEPVGIEQARGIPPMSSFATGLTAAPKARMRSSS